MNGILTLDNILLYGRLHDIYSVLHTEYAFSLILVGKEQCLLIK